MEVTWRLHAQVAPTEMLLSLERHATFDAAQDSTLELRLVHTCTVGALTGTSLPPCHNGDPSTAPASSVLPV